MSLARPFPWVVLAAALLTTGAGLSMPGVRDDAKAPSIPVLEPAAAEASTTTEPSDVEHQNGTAQCSAGVSDSLYLWNQCRLGSSVGTHNITIPAGTKLAFIEVCWSQATLAGLRQLALTGPENLDVAIPRQRAEGPSILTMHVESNSPNGAADETSLGLQVRPGGESGAALEQHYELAVSSFADGLLPAGYSAFALGPTGPCWHEGA